MMKMFLLLLTLLALISCESSELHESMEDMGDSYKAMKDSDDKSKIQEELATFKAAFDISLVQKIKPEDQAVFDEGMKKVQQQINDLEAALASNNLEAAKKLIVEIDEAREEYHEKLDIK